MGGLRLGRESWKRLCKRGVWIGVGFSEVGSGRIGNLGLAVGVAGGGRLVGRGPLLL